MAPLTFSGKEVKCERQKAINTEFINVTSKKIHFQENMKKKEDDIPKETHAHMQSIFTTWKM